MRKSLRGKKKKETRGVTHYYCGTNDQRIFADNIYLIGSEGLSPKGVSFWTIRFRTRISPSV